MSNKYSIYFLVCALIATLNQCGNADSRPSNKESERDLNSFKLAELNQIFEETNFPVKLEPCVADTCGLDIAPLSLPMALFLWSDLSQLSYNELELQYSNSPFRAKYRFKMGDHSCYIFYIPESGYFMSVFDAQGNITQSLDFSHVVNPMEPYGQFISELSVDSVLKQQKYDVLYLPGTQLWSHIAVRRTLLNGKFDQGKWNLNAFLIDTIWVQLNEKMYLEAELR